MLPVEADLQAHMSAEIHLCCLRGRQAKGGSLAHAREVAAGSPGWLGFQLSEAALRAVPVALEEVAVLRLSQSPARPLTGPVFLIAGLVSLTAGMDHHGSSH